MVVSALSQVAASAEDVSRCSVVVELISWYSSPYWTLPSQVDPSSPLTSSLVVAESEVVQVSPLISSLNTAPLDLNRKIDLSLPCLPSRFVTHAVARIARR